ncbi:excisionase [Pseudobutyrivibrio ruminis]|uniref:excisionase n=1 Tax=Pseudobutyrivibrio ruminis TaxID=46206 RepID=UPI00041B5B47|nr:excisionase [Pseudobutyrivibrio ruminis]SFQ50904.1 DNA binding domain-containing protein, excisionase family [Lachnospiraceae bacterium XBB1006]
MAELQTYSGVPLWKKYSLNIQEAAEYYGIGEKRLRQIISENRDAAFVLEVGSHTRIKRELFEKYLDESTVV